VKEKLRDEQSWLATGALCVLATVALGFILSWSRDVMVPFVLAIFVSSMVAPVLDFLVVKWNFHHSTSVVITLLIIVVVLISMSVLLLNSIQTAVDQSEEYSGQMMAAVRLVANKAEGWWKWFEGFSSAGKLGQTRDAAEALAADTTPKPGSAALAVGSKDRETPAEPRWFQSVSRAVRSVLPGLATQLAGSAAAIISRGFLVVIFAVFLLAGRDPHVARAGVYAEIDSQIRGYICTKVIISVVTGVGVWLILELLGVPMATVFGMMAFLLNFVPSIGSVVATLLPVPIVLAMYLAGADSSQGTSFNQKENYAAKDVPVSISGGRVQTAFGGSAADTAFRGNGENAVAVDEASHGQDEFPDDTGPPVFPFWKFLLAILLPGTLQMTIGNVIEPKLMGDELKLHPITILMSLAIWGLLWGAIGMLLAVPITAIVRIVLTQFDITAPAAQVLTGRLPGARDQPGSDGQA